MRPAVTQGPEEHVDVTQLPVDQVRFSQNSVGSATYLHGQRLSLLALTASMRKSGYQSDPIRVVRMPDGKFTSLDNRRLWAAQEAGLPSISAIVNDWQDRLPDTLDPDRFASRRRVVDHHGELGVAGVVIMERYERPTTIGQAAMARASHQGRTPSGERFPLMGSLERPRATPHALGSQAVAEVAAQEQPLRQNDKAAGAKGNNAGHKGTGARRPPGRGTAQGGGQER
ncbi:MAG: ParB N-terminal domain-containing protein [Actinomycetales bacterium]